MSIRRLSCLLGLGLLLCATGPVALAQPAPGAAEVFTVRGVEVDVTAETAAAAREAAHAEGHVKAMRKLLARLLPRAEQGRLRQLEAEEILAYVQDFEVAHERTSDVRYLASLTFRFKPEPMRELLRANGLLHAETMSKPVVVLPVFGTAGEAKLWDEDNPWWAAWAARPPGGWLVPLVVPLGDLNDLTAIDAERALAGDAEGLSAIARRYGAEDVLVTQAVRLDDLETGQPTLQVGTSRFGRHAQQTVIANYVQAPEETPPQLLARAADAVDAELQEAWKQSNLLRPGSQRTIEATVPVSGLADWLEVQRRLKGVAAVRRTEVSELSRRKTEVAITFVGEEEQLVVAMAQSDLDLRLRPGSGWEIRLIGAAGADEPGAAPASTAEPSAAQPPAAPAPSGTPEQRPAGAAGPAPAASDPAAE